MDIPENNDRTAIQTTARGDEQSPSILQVGQGRIIPAYSSAYSLRCHSLIENSVRRLISVGGSIFSDQVLGYSEQYRSLILTGLSYLKGNRSLEINISNGKYLRRKYLNRLIDLVKLNQIIIFEGPWQYTLVEKYLENKFVVYDAHNVEYLLRSNNIYQETARVIEGKLLSRADLVLTFTKNDKEKFKEIYGVNDRNIFFAPHSLSYSSMKWKGDESKHIVFIGSLYSMNNYALDKIEEMAASLKDFTFDIIGSAKPSKRPKTGNIVFHGVVDDSTKDSIMSNAFLALNPVKEGGGRNFKMLDYLAHGLPILSTLVGVRGFDDFDISGCVVVSELDKFQTEIDNLAKNRNKLKKMSLESSKLYDEILKTEKRIDGELLITQEYRSRTL